MSDIQLSPRYPRALQPRAAVALMQAVEAAPTLARLVSAAKQSQECLLAAGHLLPGALRSGVQAGPIDNGVWCLLAANSAVAAKLRQISPSIVSCVQAKGYMIASIRIKVQMRTG
jgi:Dna[CI] antecedent, DciA